jgi:DnaJ family protein B protein 11
MPNYENNNKVGDLYVTFDIDFPKKDLTEEEKKSKKFVILFIFIYRYISNF